MIIGQTHDIWMSKTDPGLSKYFIPPVIEIPQLPNAELKALSFQYKNVPVLAVQKVSQALDTDFMIWGMCGVSSDPLGFSFQIFHDHGNTHRAMFNKHQRQANALGTAQFPLFLLELYPVSKGDALMVEMKNLANVNPTTIIEVLLWGAIPA